MLDAGLIKKEILLYPVSSNQYQVSRADYLELRIFRNFDIKFKISGYKDS